jgi:hypothetical protein
MYTEIESGKKKESATRRSIAHGKRAKATLQASGDRLSIAQSATAGPDSLPRCVNPVFLSQSADMLR